MSDQEQKYIISEYLKIDNYINQLEYEKAKVSERFYATHSLIGGMLSNVPGSDYTHATTADMCILIIDDQERKIQHQIDYLKQKQEVFKNNFTDNELNQLRRDMQLSQDTKLVNKAIKLINKRHSQAEKEHKKAVGSWEREERERKYQAILEEIKNR